MHERIGERNSVILIILVKYPSRGRACMCIGRAKLVFLVILVELSGVHERVGERNLEILVILVELSINS
jgi:hypothetical protein